MNSRFCSWASSVSRQLNWPQPQPTTRRTISVAANHSTKMVFFFFHTQSPCSNECGLHWYVNMTTCIVPEEITSCYIIVINLLQNLDTINLVTKSVLDEKWWQLYTCRDRRTEQQFLLYTICLGRQFTLDYLQSSCRFNRMLPKNRWNDRLNIAYRYIYQRFHNLPFYVLLGTDKISFSVRSSLSTSFNNPYWQQLRNTLWAEKCLLVLKETIEDSVNEGKQHLDPLAALTWYLASSKEQKLKLKYMEDPTIQLLCTISETWFIAVILFLLQIKNFRWTSTNKKEGYESWIGSISSYWITSRIDNSCQGSTRCSGMYCIAVINLNSHSPNAFNATIIKTVSSFFCDW